MNYFLYSNLTFQKSNTPTKFNDICRYVMKYLEKHCGANINNFADIYNTNLVEYLHHIIKRHTKHEKQFENQTNQ